MQNMNYAYFISPG